MDKAVAGGGGGVLWVMKNPLPQTKKGPPKGVLKCIKRPTRMFTACMSNDAAYYTDIDLDTIEDLNKFAIQSARACMF